MVSLRRAGGTARSRRTGLDPAPARRCLAHRGDGGVAHGLFLSQILPRRGDGRSRCSNPLPAAPDLVFCPTGGVTIANAPTYLGLSNVICVGGSWVVPEAAIKAGISRPSAALQRKLPGSPARRMKRPVPASGLGHLRITLDEDAYPGRAGRSSRAYRQDRPDLGGGQAMGMSYKRAWGLVQALNAGSARRWSKPHAGRGGTGRGRIDRARA